MDRHAAAPDPPQQNGITGDSGLQPTFSTKSAETGRSAEEERRSQADPFRTFGSRAKLALDANKTPEGQPINHLYGGRGVYFDDPNGHLMELITRPYGPTPQG